MKYLGHLSQKDHFYIYLCREILPQLCLNGAPPDFRVYSIPASNHVCLYEDPRNGTRLIGKFFGGILNRSPQTAFRRMEREFNNLQRLRSVGFAGYPHSVVRPLGLNGSLNCVIVEEFCQGTPLTDFLDRAMQEGAKEKLIQKLTALAYFLATLHNKTATSEPTDIDSDCSYFDRIIGQLRQSGHIAREREHEFSHLKERWRNKGHMREERTVTVHGDVTPTNILFGDGLQVVALDLERMKRADRVFDLGLVTGELKHFFMQQTGDHLRAEPFIGHFLREYSCHFPDPEHAFASITRGLPFYMGLTLLRIARNSWINGEYRRQLLNEARKTLE